MGPPWWGSISGPTWANVQAAERTVKMREVKSNASESMSLISGAKMEVILAPRCAESLPELDGQGDLVLE
jgi:hypothetical protein